MRYLLSLVILLLNFLPSNAYVISIDESMQNHLMFANEVEILKDPSKSIELDQILANPEKFNFTISDKKEEFSHCADCNYWIRFKVQEKGHKSLWVLEILDSRFNEFKLFIPDRNEKSGYRERVTGIKYG